MDPRTATARTLALGSLLAGAACVLVLATSATSTTGCSSADTEPAPDADLPPCNRGPFTFGCDPPAQGQPSCNTGSSSQGVLARLPQNMDYPVGCVVNFVGPRDPQGDCRLESVCKCVIGEIEVDAGAPVSPVTPTDAGDDADTDVEAGAAPTPPPAPTTTTTGPMWLCNG